MSIFHCVVCLREGTRLHGIGHENLGMITLCHECYKLWVKGDRDGLQRRMPAGQLTIGL